jgi:hypothetical protein
LNCKFQDWQLQTCNIQILQSAIAEDGSKIAPEIQYTGGREMGSNRAFRSAQSRAIAKFTSIQASFWLPKETNVMGNFGSSGPRPHSPGTGLLSGG